MNYAADVQLPNRLEKANQLLLKIMEQEYGNKLSEAHKLELLSLLRLKADYCSGLASGHNIVSLPTGMGKTTAIVAFIAASFAAGDESALSVACSTVEALCDLKRKLIERGVPENLIGLKHSKFNASEKSTGNESRRYQLVTHKLLRQEKDFGLFGMHEGKPRALCIYDEACFTSDSVACRIEDADAGLHALRSKRSSNPELQSLCDFLDREWLKVRRVVDMLATVPNDRGLPIQFAGVGKETADHWINLLKSDAINLKGLGDDLAKFLELTSSACQVVRAGNSYGIVGISEAITSALKNVLVLDATAPIRKLELLDKRFKIASPSASSIKSYRNVQAHQILAGGGRATMKKHLGTPTGITPVSREIISIVEERRLYDPDHCFLIFVYKDRPGMNMRDRLERDMQFEGIDTRAEYFDGKESKKKFQFLTWGQHEGLNGYEHCRTVILVGIQQRCAVSLSGQARGQMRDLGAAVSDKMLKDFVLSEVGHCAVQAMGRGGCRKVYNGNAASMHVYLIHKDAGLKDMVAPILPGIDWQFREPKFMARPCKQREILRNVLSYLSTVAGDISKISTRAIKAALQIPKDRTIAQQFTRAMNQLSDFSKEWKLESRSLVRQA